MNSTTPPPTETMNPTDYDSDREEICSSLLDEILFKGITTIVPKDIPLDFLKGVFSECSWLGNVSYLYRLPNDDRDENYTGEDYVRLVILFKQLHDFVETNSQFDTANSYATFELFIPCGLTRYFQNVVFQNDTNTLLFTCRLYANTRIHTAEIPDENKVVLLEGKLNETEKQMATLLDQVERQGDILEQLIAGLFCDDTQGNYKRLLFDILQGDQGFAEMKGVDSSRWEQNPTTVQGDDLERRVLALEKRDRNTE
jgi:hypothetical protein